MTIINEEASAVSIPRDLYDQIVLAIKGTGFASVDDYITYILRVSVGKKQEHFDEDEQEKVTSRLKALGYI